MDIVTWAWLVAAIVLGLSEFLIPGLVVIFVGAGAGAVALAHHLGWVDGWMQQWTLFFVSSLALLLVLRGMLQGLLPGDRVADNSDVDADAIGQVVEVITPAARGQSGEVRLRGVRWAARCERAGLQVGDRVRLVARDNLTWQVEQVVEPLGGPNPPAPRPRSRSRHSDPGQNT